MNKLKVFLAILVSMILVIGTVFGLFLRPIRAIEFTQKLARKDSEIFYQEQHTRHYKNLIIFERRGHPMTENEQDILVAENARLDVLREERKEILRSK